MKAAVRAGDINRARLLTSAQVAELMGLTHQAVRNALYRGLEGKTIPPSFTLGRRRVWLRQTVTQWLRERAKQQARKSRTGARAVDIPRIVVGLELVDDDGDEVVVQKINEAKGTVLLETSDGDKYSMAVRELRTKLKDGEFARIVDGTDEEGDFDDPQEEDDEDEAT